MKSLLLLVLVADVASGDGSLSAVGKLLDQGLAVTLIVVIIVAIAYVGRRVFGKNGYAEQITKAHLDYVQKMDERQRELNVRINEHCTTEEGHDVRMRHCVAECLSAAIEAGEKLELSPKSMDALRAAKAEVADGGRE